MSAPEIKGWCPGAHRPMMSGDGLVVRVRPFQGEINKAQILGLCDISETFGNGVIDLTSRANLQIRGVSEDAHQRLLAQLDALGLIDPDLAFESRRNILMPHTWEAGDLTDRLYQDLLRKLPDLPDLPGKMGFALDTAEKPYLRDGSADFRFELGDSGQLILRADGCTSGLAVTENSAMNSLQEMAEWFASTGGDRNGRMARHLAQVDLPNDWTSHVPRKAAARPTVGPMSGGTILGAPFGKMKAEDLRNLAKTHDTARIRLMTNRMIYLKDTHIEHATGFVIERSPLMQAHACPGAPFCPQATVATIGIARELATYASNGLHVSGCSKGCAHPKAAAVTLVGRNGEFDLVLEGRPWDEPSKRGVNPQELIQEGDLN